MADRITAVDWPLAASTVKNVDEEKATHLKAQYQPQNDHRHEQLHRKRFINTGIGLALAILSCATSITLFIYLGDKMPVYEWVFLAWFVVSAGMTAMLALLVPLMCRNYQNGKMTARMDGKDDTPEKALGRTDVEQHHVTALQGAPNCNRNEAQHYIYPSTPVRPRRMIESTSSRSSISGIEDSTPFDLCKTRGRITGQDCSPPHVKTFNDNNDVVINTHTLTPISLDEEHPSPLRSSPVQTTPPRFPSPAQLRDLDSSAVKLLRQRSDDRFGSDESPSSVVCTKAEEEKVARSDSLNKLRQATLRRKQAFGRV